MAAITKRGQARSAKSKCPRFEGNPTWRAGQLVKVIHVLQTAKSEDEKGSLPQKVMLSIVTEPSKAKPKSSGAPDRDTAT